MSDGRRRRKAKEQAAQAGTSALQQYGAWRPRLGRGATWAGAAGGLTAIASDAASKKFAIPVAAAAGLAGVGDRMLEERVEKDQKMRTLVGKGFKAASSDQDREGLAETFPSHVEAAHLSGNRGVVAELFSRKARNTALAADQLKSAFPVGGSNPNSFGHSVVIASGTKSASSPFQRFLG